MNNKSLYFTALERLNTSTSGSYEFENICRIIIKFMYPGYNFLAPEGGRGTQDGGYDGNDQTKKAKLACSTQKDYKTKIKSEVEKSKRNKDSHLFYLSNQVIPNDENKDIRDEYASTGIELYIHGIACLSEELEKYFRYNNDIFLYDLLNLSSLIFGDYYRRDDVIFQKVKYTGNIYKKQILNIDKSLCQNNFFDTERIISENPLFDLIYKWCSEKQFDSLGNITLCGIGYLGKSFIMKMAYNSLIMAFKDINSDFKFMPFLLFESLKHYYQGNIKEKIKNNIDPLLFFLDGLDELSEPSRIDLDRELQSILSNNKRVYFIITGRNSSFDNLEIYKDSIKLNLEKYIDYNDTELLDLINNYKRTPISELISIPAYRSFIIEKKISKESKLEDFYNLLVKDNLFKDKERDDYSKNITKRETTGIDIENIISILSDFCFHLFVNGKYLFTENELKEYLNNDSQFIFIIQSSIIEYNDFNKISFISNFYFEYFISNALITKEEKDVFSFFFIRNRININLIDVLVLFLNIAKTKSYNLYRYIYTKMNKDNIIYILLSEFDSIPDKDRYNYFIKIFKKYKKDKFWIYYGRFHQPYNPLKNIDNMALRMQQLLPDDYKVNALHYLIKEINNYLVKPSKDEVLSFGNAITLLIPHINNIWSQNELNNLKEIALPLIRFFTFNKYSKELENILSERFIFDWYKDFNWTLDWNQSDWELFYYNISGNTCNLLSEIINEIEFSIKYNIFSIFYDNITIKPLLFPILRYAMKNIYSGNNNTASFVSDELTDESDRHLIKSDDRTYILTRILRNTDIKIKDAVNLLEFAVNNNIYDDVKESYDNPIKIFEEILYSNIESLDKNDYKAFSIYYLNWENAGFTGFYEKLFQIKQTKELDNLMGFLVKEIIDRKLNNWGTGNLLHKLINFTDSTNALNYLYLIKERMPDNIYNDTVYYIYNNLDHILKNSEFIINEYNTNFYDELLKKEEREKKAEEIRKNIDFVNNNDIDLMLDNNKMINEIIKINEYILASVSENNKNKLHILYDLRHTSLVNIILYEKRNYDIPVFSECALKIIEDFYRDNIYDINIITKQLQDYTFREEYFYIYFYWVYIKNIENSKDNKTKEKINICQLASQKIINNINTDVYNKFTNMSIDDFQCINIRNWLTPFLYYFKHLLNKTPPDWMKPEHILKLLVTPNPGITVYINNEKSLDWFIDIFDMISPDQIIEFGLKIIEEIKIHVSRIQVIGYFINYYNNNKNNNFKKKILNTIIDITKKLFDVKLENISIYGEFQSIGLFWNKCNENHIERIFSKFTSEIITLGIKKEEKDYNYEYRKMVLQYCIKVATIEQKNNLIHEIEVDMKNKKLSDDENIEINSFLAALGREESIKVMITLYIKGKSISRHGFNEYPLGYMKQSDNLLISFINLLIYSNEKSSDRRGIIREIAKKGIKEQLNKKNFKYFENEITKEIIKLRKISSWLSEHYNDYLIEMEQYVFKLK